MGERTRYAKSGDLHIAYQAVGESDTSVVYIPTWMGQIEVLLEEPSVKAFLTRVCSFARVISFDRRGAGLSDPWLGGHARGPDGRRAGGDGGHRDRARVAAGIAGGRTAGDALRRHSP